MKRNLILSLAAAFAGFSTPLTAAPLLPELLFKDTFDSAGPSDDINAENAARQSGLLAPLTYVTAQNPPQLGQEGLEGSVKLSSNSLLSPERNFTSGSTFFIEFDVNPGVDDDPSDGYSGDWCAIVFGSSSQNVFVNGSDGIGILFRNNGDIQTFTGGTAVGGGPGIPGGLPRDRAFHVKLEVATGGFNGSPANVKMFVDGTEAAIGAAGSTTLTKADGFRNNLITLEGYGFPGPWVHTFDNLQVSAIPDIQVGPNSTSINRAISPTSEPIGVTIPAQLNATAAAQVKVISSNPLVAAATGADGTGTLTLNFEAGGPTTKTFTINGIAPGTASLRVEGPADVRVNGGVNVFVIAGIGLDEVVFKDNFNVSEPSADINFEKDTARQSGTAKPLDYTEAADSAAGGSNDDLTAVNPAAYPGKLYVMNRSNGVSPARNFIDGPEFYIEAEIHAGPNAPDQTDENWAAIVFGNQQPNNFVITPDGFGILFRNNGAMQVFDGPTAIFSSAPGLLPAPPFKVRIDSKAVNFAGAPAAISLKINDQTVLINGVSETYVKTAGFRGNYVTLVGYSSALEHTFDDLTIGAKACINFRDAVIESTSGQTVTTAIQIPAAMTATAAATITVRSSNPAVANAAGAVNGELALVFPVGQNLLPLNIQVLGAGSTRFELSNAAGVCMGEPLVVNSRTALVRNPSFEENYNPNFPHYSDISQWVIGGGAGVNNSSGPFADNSTIPDQAQAAFLQGNAQMSQNISGLVAGKKYWIQFRYNARNCCGGTIDLVTSIDDAEVDRVTNIRPQAPNDYGFRNVIFTASAATAKLTFAGSANGDATVVVDAVSITQRDDGNVILENPSFEASGDIAGAGSIGNRRLSGWTATGDAGVNFSGVSFANNGLIPDQDHAAFLSGPSSISQRALRLTASSGYKLEWSYNAPTGKTSHLRVKVGGNVIWEQDVTAVGNAAYRSGSVEFIASGTTADITFEQTLADAAVLIDNVRLLGQAITLPCLAITPVRNELSVGLGATLTVTVPAQLIAAGPATIRLKSANPAVAALEGAAGDGTLAVEFAAGGEPSRPVTLNGVSRGSTTIDVVDAAGLCVDTSVQVTVIGSFIRNPSFEANFHPNFPGYGAIDSWSGGSGINNNSGPFHDNGLIADRKQIGFMQGSGTLSQNIGGLVIGKKYWLQFRYNTRNCCGGSLAFTANIDDTPILSVESVSPVFSPNEYHVAHAEFTAEAATAMLGIQTTVSGDATLLLDAITIVQRDDGQIIVHNPSFEAEGIVPFPGYIQPDGISGWKATGQYGVNAAYVGPFADNGVNPDQDTVAFLQGASSLSQTLRGLTAGANYTATFAVNARAGNSPRLKVSFGDNVLLEQDIAPVGANNAYHSKQVVFTASGEEGTLMFEQVAAGDNTVLIDNVIVKGGGTVEPNRPLLTGTFGAGNTLRLSWPGTATGYNLVASDTVNGVYTAVPEPVVIDGPNNVVTVQITGAARYFQLRK